MLHHVYRRIAITAAVTNIVILKVTILDTQNYPSGNELTAHIDGRPMEWRCAFPKRSECGRNNCFRRGYLGGSVCMVTRPTDEPTRRDVPWWHGRWRRLSFYEIYDLSIYLWDIKLIIFNAGGWCVRLPASIGSIGRSERTAHGTAWWRRRRRWHRVGLFAAKK